jgi:hypothetical protein
MERRETVHIGGVNVRPASQQHLHLAAVPGRAGRQEHTPVAETDLVQCFPSCQLFENMTQLTEPINNVRGKGQFFGQICQFVYKKRDPVTAVYFELIS